LVFYCPSAHSGHLRPVLEKNLDLVSSYSKHEFKKISLNINDNEDLVPLYVIAITLNDKITPLPAPLRVISISSVTCFIIHVIEIKFILTIAIKINPHM